METLRGKNAIVTGASRGVGVYIARALASEGVNLVLAARTAEQLESVARDLSQLGVQAVAIPTDITQAADRDALLAGAERQLGQIDILINNAAVIEWTPYAEQESQQIARIIETNLMAPLFLTRGVLPGMLERHCGHIVNNVSMAGKKGIPFEAAYAASKAGLLEWSSALRIEFEHTGVGITSILPSIITKVGMSANHGMPAPRLAGAVPPEPVAKAVIKAIRYNPQEIIVRALPTRPLLALAELWPELGDMMLKIMGVVKLQRRLAAGDKTHT
jgi:short-subunit dehydrogenase